MTNLHQQNKSTIFPNELDELCGVSYYEDVTSKPVNKKNRAVELLKQIDDVFGWKPNRTHIWLAKNDFGSVGAFENWRNKRTTPYDSSITSLERALQRAQIEQKGEWLNDAIDALRQIRNHDEEQFLQVAHKLIAAASIIRAHQNRDEVLRSFGLVPEDVPLVDPEIDQLLAGLVRTEDGKDNS